MKKATRVLQEEQTFLQHGIGLVVHVGTTRLGKPVYVDIRCRPPSFYIPTCTRIAVLLVTECSCRYSVPVLAMHGAKQQAVKVRLWLH